MFGQHFALYFQGPFFFWGRILWKRKGQASRDASSLCLVVGPPKTICSAQAIMNFSLC